MEENDLTLQDLLALARDYRVTPKQLERWHEFGLLPRPKLVHRVGLRGARSLYPNRAGEQLLALCRIHRKERRLAYVGFLLWFDGYALPVEVVKHAFEAMVLKSFRTFKQRSHGQDPLEFSETIARKVKPQLGKQKLWRLALRNIGNPTHLTSVIVALVQMALNNMPAFDSIEDYIGDEDEPALSVLLTRAMGISMKNKKNPAQEHRQHWLTEDPIALFTSSTAQELFSLEATERAVVNASVEELEQARVDAHELFESLLQFIQLLTARSVKNPLGLGILRFMPLDSAVVKAQQVMMMLVLRKAGFGTAVDELSRTFTHQLPLLEHHHRLITALQIEIPAVGRLLAKAPLRIDVSSRHDTYLAKLQLCVEEHQEDMHAFWVRHPELLDENDELAQ